MPLRLDTLTNKTRPEMVSLSTLTGCVLGVLCLLVLPDFRGLFVSLDGLFYLAYYLISFGAFFAVAGDAVYRNSGWIARTVRWKQRAEVLPVQLTPYPQPDLEIRLVVGEQHQQKGDRSIDPIWFALENKSLFAGLLVVGDTGSGKTTCTGYPWIETMIRHGLGGLILDAGGSYVKFVKAQMAAAGRAEDLILLEPGGDWKYNPVAKPEMSSTDLAGWLFMMIKNLSSASSTSASDAFWDQAGQEYANAIIDLCRLQDPHGLTLEVLYQMNTSEKARENILTRLELELADGTSPERAQRIEYVRRFWRDQFTSMAPNLRGSIPAQFNAVASMFSSDYDINQTFCPHPHENGIFPGFDNAALDSGKVVIINMPLRKYPKAGRIIATMLKLDFQRSVLRRSEGRSESEVGQPVFLVIDEAQNYVSASREVGDAHYLAESRKNKPINIYMSQSIDSFKDAFRDESGCNVFFNNLRTKVFLSQEGHESQRIAAELCGKSTQYRKTVTESEAGRATDVSYTAGGLTHEQVAVSRSVSYAEQDEFLFRPHEFRNLPKFVSVVSPFDGDRKLEPRVVYMKPVFVDGEGAIQQRAEGTWFQGDNGQCRSYRDLSQ